jgi:predicted dithiol-disulfide oxidoreductase (DUF899 family)
MNTPAIVSLQEWEAARQRLLVKEKELTRARDALAAERRRMPWVAVEKDYRFEGPRGEASLLDLFEGRRQLIVYRAFFEPGVVGWPEHACVGCSMMADHVGYLAHLNARNTTLVFASRAPQKDIERLKARMGWERIPWYTITDDFDKDFGVDEWHGHNAWEDSPEGYPQTVPYEWWNWHDEYGNDEASAKVREQIRRGRAAGQAGGDTE